MSEIRNIFNWYFMYCKRLLHKVSFWVILLLIPISVPVLNALLTQDTGIFNIAVCTQDKESEYAKKIINNLIEKDSIVNYIYFENEDDARNAVQSMKMDVAWIFSENFDKKLNDYASGKPFTSLGTIVTREDSTHNNLTNEFFYDAVMPDVSFLAFKNFINENVPTKVPLDDETLMEYYNDHPYNKKVVKIVRIDSDEEIIVTSNVLASPIRGFLATIILLCGIAAAMFFLSDSAEGKYDWLSYKKRMIPAFISCLSAVSISALVVLVTLFISGIGKNPLNEIIIMVCYIPAITVISMLLALTFRSAIKLGACIPFITILTLVMCPVFFNLSGFGNARLMLPTYYYLNSLTDVSYALYSLIYTAVIFLICYIANELLNRKRFS